MIEILLQAERQLTMGLVDQAERLYWQAIEADPRNAIAVVGLARVAIERADDRTAYAFAVQALGIDPENAAALRLEARLAEVLAARGQPVQRPPFAVAAGAAARARQQADLAAAREQALAPGAPDRPLSDRSAEPDDAATPPPRRRGGLFRRFRDG